MLCIHAHMYVHVWVRHKCLLLCSRMVKMECTCTSLRSLSRHGFYTYIHIPCDTYIHSYRNTYIHTRAVEPRTFSMHTYIYIYIYTYIHIRAVERRTFLELIGEFLICMHTCMYPWMNVYTYMYICMYADLSGSCLWYYIYIYIYIYTYVCVCTVSESVFVFNVDMHGHIPYIHTYTVHVLTFFEEVRTCTM